MQPNMAKVGSHPRVFLDISIGTTPVGRLVIELFTDKTPKTCEKYVRQPDSFGIDWLR
jgi:hypothetical protein